jgi:tetratricopeptide (TPR) repeat protein
VEKRNLTEEKIKAMWDKIPEPIRFDILAKLAQSALDHSDNDNSTKLINEARTLLDEYQWPLDQRVQLWAKLAGLRFRCGDPENARTDLAAAMAFFNANTNDIENIYRTQTLCPVAEVYKMIGDPNTALSIYKQAVEEIEANLTVRIRAKNLSATCCSMAMASVEPDTDLCSRIKQIKEELGQPR